MNKNQKDILKKIKKLAIKIDHQDSFAGKSKGNKHLMRVVRVAEFLAKKNKADEFITLSGAYLHDTPLSYGDDYNYTKNKKIIIKILNNFDLTKEESKKISECVASHEGIQKIKILEAKIVHDADVLEKTGLLGIIRHTWKLTNLGQINYKAIKNEDVNKILNHIEWRKEQLYTNTAKEIANYLSIPIDKKKAKNIIVITSSMAHKSIITEKIAIALKKSLDNLENKKLTEQLSLSYLSKFK